jgi:hypothetical protein
MQVVSAMSRSAADNAERRAMQNVTKYILSAF